MEDPKQNNSFTDHERIAELKAKIDQMDESNFDEKVFHEYLNALGDDAKPNEPIDVEASLARVRSKHAVLIERLDEKAKLRSAQTAKSNRRRRWGYRLVVIAAAIIILNAMCIVAFGHSMFNYAAKWGEETFGFFRESDFETSEDGNIIYYPDGTVENRSDMSGYDHSSYKPLPRQSNNEQEYDPTAAMGSDENPISLPAAEPDQEFASIPDTDVSALGLEKESSSWNTSHTMEYIYIRNSNIVEVAKAFGVNESLFPTIIPSGFEQTEIKVTKDHLKDCIDFSASYVNQDTEYLFSVSANTLSGSNGGIIEKDDRSVITYSVHNVDWYIMHNLENVNAVAVIGNRQVLFNVPISVDEMKKVIDSVYERN